MTRSQRLWLLLPPLLFCAVDGTLTLAGQPVSYWRGEFDTAGELNPLFDVLLRQHPLQFLAGLACWIAGIAAMVLFFPGGSPWSSRSGSRLAMPAGQEAGWSNWGRWGGCWRFCS